MAYKKYNYKDFTCKVNDKTYVFRCWAENTKYGFRHLCLNFDDLGYAKYTSKATYYNRTWERFTYETVLKKAIEQLPKEERQAVYDILIEGKAEQVKKECDNFFNDFKKEYEKLPQSTKETLKNTTITNEEQAKTLLMGMKMLNIINNK